MQVRAILFRLLSHCVVLVASACAQVRDLLTSTSEQAGKSNNPTLKADAVPVDAVVSTIGFPLVGGPAGTMEGGRQADVAKAILTAKNIPYMVAAPLLIQVCIHMLSTLCTYSASCPQPICTATSRACMLSSLANCHQFTIYALKHDQSIQTKWPGQPCSS